MASAVIMSSHVANAQEWHATPVDEMDVDTSQSEYQVKWGDTLHNLGIRTGSDVTTLMNLNKASISNPNEIYANSLISIPTGYDYDIKHRHLDTDVLTKDNVSNLEKDVRYYTSDGEHYILNGDYYNAKGEKVGMMSIDDIKKLPLENGIYNASKPK